MKEMKTSIHILNLLLLASLFLVACNLPTNMDPTTVPPPPGPISIFRTTTLYCPWRPSVLLL